MARNCRNWLPPVALVGGGGGGEWVKRGKNELVDGENIIILCLEVREIWR